jgi:hypothetical protein
MRVTLLAANLTKWLAFGPTAILKIYGANAQGTDLWLQFFESPSVTAGDVPAISPIWFPSLVDSYYINMHSIYVDSCFAAVSTTRDTYTAPGAGLGLNVTIEYETQYPVIAGTTTSVGDLTTGVALRQIWAEATGFKNLRKLDILNSSAGNIVPVIQASDAALTTDTAAIILPVIAASAQRKFHFGAGFYPFRNDAGTIRKGCTVRFIVPGAPGTSYLPFVFSAATDFKVRAVYE